MFGVRRVRGRWVARPGVFVVVVGLVLAVTPQPSQAKIDGGLASTDGQAYGALAFTEGGAGPGPSDCDVETYEGEGSYNLSTSVDFSDGTTEVRESVVSAGDDGVREVEAETSSTDTDGDGEADVEVGVQEDDLVNRERNNQYQYGYDSFSVETVDGKFDLDGDGWSVWRVWCGDMDREQPPSIVATPDSPLTLGPAALDYIEGYVPDPELSLRPFDEVYEWTYVQAPIDFRTTPESVQGAQITADTGGPDEVRRWITVTAVAQTVVFDSGDDSVDPSSAECLAGEAVKPYVPETPGACSFTYRNSSSIADDGVFEAELSVTWQVSYVASDGSIGTLVMDPVVQQEDVAVAEVKAVNVY